MLMMIVGTSTPQPKILMACPPRGLPATCCNSNDYSQIRLKMILPETCYNRLNVDSSKNVIFRSEYRAAKKNLVDAGLVVGEVLKDGEGGLDRSVGHQLQLDLSHVASD